MVGIPKVAAKTGILLLFPIEILAECTPQKKILKSKVITTLFPKPDARLLGFATPDNGNNAKIIQITARDTFSKYII